MITKILVPLDGSKLAAKILSVVEEFVKGYQAHITLVTFGHVNGCSGTLGLASEANKDAAVSGSEILKSYLEKTADNLKEKGLNVDWVYEEATPAEAIVTFADRLQMDLIAMTTHGKGGVSWVIGRVVEKVLSITNIPVLLLDVLEIEEPICR